ncbi:ElaA protein [Lewinella marina]|uniref:GNAT family N-acetyltransferase n=1 Tax=Neolewinella marina TaxID=438751 RepID=A0A2G0CGN3_9BACT|nr:GNAT family N-acetyltransferase [Neolewinella marina]NJB86401.1 ElaA protein [Neolewinella marina]PHK99132.1 GNAT family N-acetyltransferase [Neolewinella marina]
MSVTWKCYAFDELDVHLLYAILALRQEVFVVEQTCWYQDADGKDQAALHVVGSRAGEVVAYTRLLPRGVSYPEYASIGRVITAPAVRGEGLGRPLMRESIRLLYERYGVQPIKIGAQAHLQDFYGSLGFVGVGGIYDEDGIPHRSMVLEPA